MKREINIFKIKVHPYSKKEFLEIIENNLLLGNTIIQNGINAASINDLKDNFQLLNAYKNSNLVNIDGMSIVWAARYLGHTVPERVACPDLAIDILALAQNKGYSVFFLGTDEVSLNVTINNLVKSYPRLIISGYQHGYFHQNEELSIIKMINDAKTDILFLGLPSPKKELFIEKYKNQLSVKYTLGVGGFFDILSGKMRRAPVWMQKNGLEWLFRFLQEPKRMWSRYLIGNFKFLKIVLKEKKNLY